MIKTIVSFFSLLMLSSCVTFQVDISSPPPIIIERNVLIYHDATPAVTLDEATINVSPELEAHCGVFELPDIPDRPSPPVIPMDQRNDARFISRALIDYVSLLRTYIDTTNERLLSEYERYLSTCINVH